MIFLNDFLSLIKFKITGGCEHLWNCFGQETRILDHDADDYNMSVVFSPTTQEIYQISFNADNLDDPKYPHPHFFWVNGAYEQALFDEAAERGVDILLIDQTVVEQVHSYEVAINYIMENTGLTLGEEMDLDLDDDVILWLSKKAMQANITMNALINNILRESLNNGTFKKVAEDAAENIKNNSNKTP